MMGEHFLYIKRLMDQYRFKDCLWMTKNVFWAVFLSTSSLMWPGHLLDISIVTQKALQNQLCSKIISLSIPSLPIPALTCSFSWIPCHSLLRDKGTITHNLFRVISQKFRSHCWPYLSFPFKSSLSSGTVDFTSWTCPSVHFSSSLPTIIYLTSHHLSPGLLW